MLGQIDSYDADAKTGVVKSADKTYTFHMEDWLAQVPPDEGDEITFEVEETAARKINLVGAALAPPAAVKYKYVAAALALLFGYTGIHRIYLGFYWVGLAQLLVTIGTVGYGALWGFVDAILIFSGHVNKDAKGRPLK
jgi:TM2 domain-containing membrane protein YozV